MAPQSLVERLADHYYDKHIGKTRMEWNCLLGLSQQFQFAPEQYEPIYQLSSAQRHRMFQIVWMRRIRNSFFEEGEHTTTTEELDLTTLFDLCTGADGEISDEATDELVECLQQNQSIRELIMNYELCADLGLRRWFRIFSALGSTVVDLDLNATGLEENGGNGGIRPVDPPVGWLAALLRPLKSLQKLKILTNASDVAGVFRVVRKDMKQLVSLFISLGKLRPLDLSEAAVLKHHTRLDSLVIAYGYISPPIDAFRGPALTSLQLNTCVMQPRDWLTLARQLSRNLHTLGIPIVDSRTPGIFDCLPRLPNLVGLSVGPRNTELIPILRQCPGMKGIVFRPFLVVSEEEVQATMDYVANAPNLLRLGFDSPENMVDARGGPDATRRTFLTILRGLAKSTSILEVEFLLPHDVDEEDPEIVQALHHILLHTQSKLVSLPVTYEEERKFGTFDDVLKDMHNSEIRSSPDWIASLARLETRDARYAAIRSNVDRITRMQFQQL